MQRQFHLAGELEACPEAGNVINEWASVSNGWASVFSVWASVSSASEWVGIPRRGSANPAFARGAGLEVLVFCSLLVVFLLAGCTVSLCRSKITRDLLSAAVTTSQPHHSTLTIQTPAQIMGPTPAPVVPEPPPPPYHIAVLLPHQNNAQQSTDDSPPPSYEKAVS
uniref:Transmembrane protein n=1 Tax=Timema bartmani TaxID=61472 RepID=A0A7R9I2H7_9NEOP|nr:unnamed protein product [Timema bartmani]